MGSFTLKTTNPLIRQQIRNDIINIITNGLYSNDTEFIFKDNDNFNLEPQNVYLKDKQLYLKDILTN